MDVAQDANRCSLDEKDSLDEPAQMDAYSYRYVMALLAASDQMDGNSFLNGKARLVLQVQGYTYRDDDSRCDLLGFRCELHHCSCKPAHSDEQPHWVNRCCEQETGCWARV